MTNWDAISQVITVESTPESLTAAFGDEGLSGQAAGQILASSMTLSQNSETDLDKQKTQLILNVDGSDVLQVLFLEGTLYAQADVPSLIQTFGGNTAELEQLAKGAEAAGLNFVEPALEGEWLAVPGLAELANEFGGGVTPPSAAAQQKFLEEFQKIVRDEATVTSEGEEDAGEHLVATVPIKPVVTRLMEALTQIANLPGQAAEQDLSDVPDEDISLDIWVDDDAITQLEFDVTQVKDFEDVEDFPEGVDDLAIRVAFSQWDQDIEAPADAVEINPQQLIALFMGARASGSGSGSGSATLPGSGFDCSQLKGAPAEVIELYKKECPELQK
jgi:hypothetical protein